MPAAVAAAIISGVAGTAATVYSASKQSSTSKALANQQGTAASQAAELEAKSAADQLAFLREQEATRKAEWEKTQAANLAMYNSSYGTANAQYQQRQENLAPYRGLGLGALGQMGRPIPQVVAPKTAAGTIGALIGG
jgi:hypothetical protein